MENLQRHPCSGRRKEWLLPSSSKDSRALVGLGFTFCVVAGYSGESVAASAGWTTLGVRLLA